MKLKNHHILPIIFLALMVSACSTVTGREGGVVVKENAESDFHLTGEALYNERCRECHKTLGKGEEVGSDLANMPKKGDRAYLELAIRDPAKIFGTETMMPAGDDLSQKQVRSLVEYIQTLK